MTSVRRKAWIPGKRALLAGGLARLGVLAWLERTLTCRAGLAVFTYHRIANPAANPFYDNVISATPEQFYEQILWLKKHFHLPTLDELLQQPIGRGSRRYPQALITFDDGCVDNYETAAPMLAEARVPAVFFIPTAFIERPQLPWWDQTAYIIKQAQGGLASLEIKGKAPFILNLAVLPREEAIRRVIRQVLDHEMANPERLTHALGQQLNVTMDCASLGRLLYMSWDQLGALARMSDQFVIGSHTISHPRLAELAMDRQRFELAESRRLLSEKLGRETYALAYPYGGPQDVSAETMDLAAELGYKAAFTTIPGWNRIPSPNPFALKRFNIGTGDTIPILRSRLTLHAWLGRSVV